MAGRRIQALELMGRITQQALEREATALSALRSRIDALSAELVAIHADLQAQGQSRSLEAVAHMPAYLRAVRLEQARIGKELASLQKEEAQLDAAVSRRFRERKTYAMVLDSAREAERTSVNRAEAASLDAYVLMRHGQRAAERLRESDGS